MTARDWVAVMLLPKNVFLQLDPYYTVSRFRFVEVGHLNFVKQIASVKLTRVWQTYEKNFTRTVRPLRVVTDLINVREL